MPPRLPRPETHPIALLRRAEEWCPGAVVLVELVTYVSSPPGHPLRTTSDFGEDRGVELVASAEVTPATLHERLELLADHESLGLSSRVLVAGAPHFLPQVDFLEPLRPAVPTSLRGYFSLAAPALYRTGASWHLYGNRLLPAAAWPGYIDEALGTARCAAFRVDESWRCCSSQRGYSVLRWSRKPGRAGGDLPTAADAQESRDGE